MKGFIRVFKKRQIACFTFGAGGYYPTLGDAHKAAIEWIQVRKDKNSLQIEIVTQ